ncbi:MAG: hypothetical protein M5U07_09110 [Xanthobacteraceae bacterium]|nr:hypothetical protein [Xanthobacteraceae bacterium]
MVEIDLPRREDAFGARGAAEADLGGAGELERALVGPGGRP